MLLIAAFTAGFFTAILILGLCHAASHADRMGKLLHIRNLTVRELERIERDGGCSGFALRVWEILEAEPCSPE